MRQKILTQAPCAQDYGWIKFSHTIAPEPISLSSLATQVEIELDDEEILYDRGKVRLEHAGKDRAQAIGYYPQEATYFLSGEGDKEEAIIRYVDEKGKQVTLIGVMCDCAGNELGSASVDPEQPASRTAQRKALQAKMRSRKAGQQSDGIRVRYDLPSAYMSTSQADGGFVEAETAIHARANAAARVRAMSHAPRYELKQPEDFLLRRKLNKLELWINFNAPADAEHFDFSFLKYPQLAKGVAPLQGYLATSTCETLGLKQCCFAKPGACSAENGSAYCVARRNAMAIAGIGTSPDLHLEAKSAIKRERQEEREMKAETHKQQRRDAERARLCTDYKEGKVRTLPPERASRADYRRVAVPNRGMREGTPPWEEGCEENHLHHDDLRGELPDRALPIQARTLMAGTGSQGTSGETDAQQRLEGRGDRRIRRDSGSASARARHYVRLLDLRLHRLQPVRRKGARGTWGHGRNAARHGLREPAVYPTAEAIPPETLHAHAAQPGRPPGSGSSFPHSTASDETPRYARSTRRRRFAKRYWTCQTTATRNVTRKVTQTWYTLNWNIICQRLPWQSAGSGGDHA